VGAELRRWRQRRSLSQLALATAAQVSTRHLSYVENGRSTPSADLILRLAAVLDVPEAERDRLLVAGGFAPRGPARGLEADTVAAVMAGLRRLLDAHEPYPALLLDDRWDVVDANAAVDALVAGSHPRLLEPPLNVVRLCLHPDGLAPRIRNLAAWRARLLHQLDRRIARAAAPAALVALREEVRGYPGAEPDPGAPPLGPVALLEVESGGQLLRLVSVATQVEDAGDAALAGLHLETFLPADDLTRRRLLG